MSQPGNNTAIEAAKDSMPDNGEWSVLVVLEERGSGLWSGRGQDGDGNQVELEYTCENGLKIGERE